MSRRLFLVALVAVVGGAAGVAQADEGDPPSGPEACVIEEVNRMRSGDDLSWSGSIQEELRSHAAGMAERDRLGHGAMEERVGALPDGWVLYGETSGTDLLAAADSGGVERWCREQAAIFWESASHREVLADGAYAFASVGAHWDGEGIWVAVGVFSHPTYQPAPVDWPSSYSRGLVGTWQGAFYDDDGSVFQDDIERLVAAGITRGCNPPLDSRFCPDNSVTRGEMAAFLVRAFGWEGKPQDHFTDDGTSVFEAEIEALAARDVTEGCDPPDNDRFCPDRPVTRGEMATFLGRALALEPSSGTRFTDTDDSVHRGYINAVADAGITVGCDAAGDRYCPDDLLTRAQMAAFLVRAGLAG